MSSKLQNHKRWEYSKQMWYKKYHIAVDIGYQSRYGTIRLPSSDDYVEYRCRQRCTNRGIVTTVYTNNEEYADKLASFFGNKVIKLRSPASDEQLESLQSSHHVEYRDTLYHRKYRYKVHTRRNYKLGFNREFWFDRCSEVTNWINENFKDSRTQQPSGWYYPVLPFQAIEVPFLYTNDDATLMLYKMAFGSEFFIEVTEAFIP